LIVTGGGGFVVGVAGLLAAGWQPGTVAAAMNQAGQAIHGIHHRWVMAFS
jgi:hypothetical protein